MAIGLIARIFTDSKTSRVTLPSHICLFLKPRLKELFMSCVCILTPVVIAAWPAFSAAVVAAANSLGYVLVDEAIKQSQVTIQKSNRQVNLEIANSEVVTGS